MPDYRVTQSSTGTQPYWNSGSEYAGYTQGYYRSNTDLMSTIFMANHDREHVLALPRLLSAGRLRRRRELPGR